MKLSVFGECGIFTGIDLTRTHLLIRLMKFSAFREKFAE
jgi:hypothetical protein